MENEQIFIKINQIKKTCSFTGHRELQEDFSLKELKKQIKRLIEEGVEIFYNGMARGFDLISAKVVLAFRRKYKQIKLIACIPCFEQEKGYTDKEKKEYAKILKKVDEKVMVSERYFNGCMQLRDRYMADRADVLVTYCKRKTGGTAYTVNYFKKIKPFHEIIFL